VFELDTKGALQEHCPFTSEERSGHKVIQFVPGILRIFPLLQTQVLPTTTKGDGQLQIPLTGLDLTGHGETHSKPSRLIDWPVGQIQVFAETIKVEKH